MQEEVELKEINNPKRAQRKKFFNERNYTTIQFFTKWSENPQKSSFTTVLSAKSGNKDETRLLCAAVNNNFDKAKKLCDRNVDINCQSEDKSRKFTPLWLSIEYGSIDVAALLLLRGAQLDSSNKAGLNLTYFSTWKDAVPKNEKMKTLLNSDPLQPNLEKHLQEMEAEFTEWSFKHK